MNILMLTNTYLPHVGGVARSVHAFTEEFRRRGHRVLIIAPEFEGMPPDEKDVIRIPALQKFNGSDFSVRLPVPGYLTTALDEFAPDIVHSHHPFLMGDTAHRIAASRNIPLVFTHHTMYERYTHYVPGDSPALKRYVIDLATGYANLCSQVLAPSESVADVLRERGVETPISVVPTGIDRETFSSGDGSSFREAQGIPSGALVIGHTGRLAPEKNLSFLAEAVAVFLERNRESHFLVVGSGPSAGEVERIFSKRSVADRLHLAGTLEGQELVDAYHAMDIFAFASTSETQGMVLTEAMAAGVPVVALDAPGAREVVRDRRNGRLLARKGVRSFVSALEWTAAPERRSETLPREARRTAQEFSMRACGGKALAIYEELTATTIRELSPKDEDRSGWDRALRLVEMEWDLWAARTRAVGQAMEAKPFWRKLFDGLSCGWRWLRRCADPDRWGVRLLGLSRSGGEAPQPGLILVQIDGLSKAQFERALHRRRIPFLKRMLNREGYKLHATYSGLPSTTPAVQAELFYGVPCVVPSFSFRDHETGQSTRMFEPEPAERIEERRLRNKGPGLLEGGSAYSNIYSGGAEEPHFCAATIGWTEVPPVRRMLGVLLLVPFHLLSVLRIIALLGIEFGIAIVDFVRALGRRFNLWSELLFVPRRVAVCILLRELITIRAALDAIRGLPVIQVNFVGYDEQAHRRGPSSAFAHWSLGGIDKAVQRLWRAARRSAHREYQIWVYSDHGQEDAVPFSLLTGRSIQETVEEVLSEKRPASPAPEFGPEERGIEYRRLRWLAGGLARKSSPRSESPSSTEEETAPGLGIEALGPLGHIYLAESPAAHLGERERLAEALVARNVPLVVTADPQREDEAIAWTARGKFRLPEDGTDVLGEEHPFALEAARDLAALCHHADAGELIISGWNPGERPVSFVEERGAHGGPGYEETGSFALLPSDVVLTAEEERAARPADLRRAAIRALRREKAYGLDAPAARVRRSSRDTIRILTYNVHGCVGVDGRLSTERIARVMAQCDADIAALQELDSGRRRSGGRDQAHEIARELEMDFHFHPALQVGEEQYGNAVLSRFPMRIVKAGALPAPAGRPSVEPRGAIWVALEVGSRVVHLLNTHLGLLPRERLLQVEALLGEEWLGDARFEEPRIVCGDFNAGPGSPVHRKLASVLQDAQVALDSHRPRRTWTSRHPFRRIDHVFTGEALEVLGVEVLRSQLAGLASDHLPLLVEVRL